MCWEVQTGVSYRGQLWEQCTALSLPELNYCWGNSDPHVAVSFRLEVTSFLSVS